MYLLSEPVCTRCRKALPMRALWAFARASDRSTPLKWLNRSGLFTSKFGVECPNCGAKFRVLQGRVRVVRFVCWGALLVAVAVVGAWARRVDLSTPALELFVALLFVYVGFTATERLTPYFARIRPIADGETVGFPLYALYQHRND
jgi:hypothetical protein